MIDSWEDVRSDHVVCNETDRTDFLELRGSVRVIVADADNQVGDFVKSVCFHELLLSGHFLPMKRRTGLLPLPIVRIALEADIRMHRDGAA
jgi:hypothetical protein